MLSLKKKKFCSPWHHVDNFVHGCDEEEKKPVKVLGIRSLVNEDTVHMNLIYFKNNFHNKPHS